MTEGKRTSVWWLGILFTLAITGCTTMGQVKPSAPRGVQQEAGETVEGWWYARFRVEWPEGSEPDWSMDLILAHRVVAPVLHKFRERISLWRFHRRAARDRSGHRFSFIFYASPATAKEVYTAIQSSNLLDDMEGAGLVDASYDETDKVIRPNIEDTSDRNWSPEIQRSWPFFIMGVSRAWLNLIDGLSAKTFEGGDASDLFELRSAYLDINEEVKEIWRKEGSHAFLHHLNAGFGYEPLIIYEKRLMNF